MKRFLPPHLFFCCILFILGVSIYPLGPSFLSFPWNLMGIVLIVVGLAITLVSNRAFMEVETNIKTFDAPDQFVRDGLFAYSRNPMYLGFVLSLCGMAMCAGVWIALLAPILFFELSAYWYIPFEEDVMRATFGEEYLAYCQQTRRWL